jgi:serine/threonine protein kinase
LALHIKEKKKYAIKIFKPSFLNTGLSARTVFAHEINALLSLDHDNIVKCITYGDKGKIETNSISMEGVYFIVLEYIGNQTLMNLVHEFKHLDEEVVKYFV